MNNIEKKSFTFTAPEEGIIHVFSWLPAPQNIKGVVVIAHGMAEYANRYDEFARFLAQNNFAVYAPDHRGHGFTLTNSKVGFFSKKDGWELVVSDLHKLIKITKEKHPEMPTILFGHSMGSLLARNYASDYGRFINKLIISGTATDPGFLSVFGRYLAKTMSFLIKPHTQSGLLNKLTFVGANKTYKPKRTKFDFLSRDNNSVDKYIKDPLCGFNCSTSFYADLLTGVQYVNKIENVRKIPTSLPIFVISGDDDPVGNYGIGVKKVYQQLLDTEHKNTTLKLYPGTRHELTNEINRKEVFEDVLSWINK